MRWLALCLALHSLPASAQWLIVLSGPRLEAGAPFELVAIPPPDQGAPSELPVRIRTEAADISLPMKAIGPMADGRRVYEAVMPASMVGPVTVQLANLSSNVLAATVSRRDAVQSLTGRVMDEPEPPLSQEEPMYFIIGSRGPTTARFQLSFKYRLFDTSSGFGHDQPWLSAFYFGYTQNSLWDLSSESKAFRDTSYRPSFFWRWTRTDERAFIDAVRLGLEHESNGSQGEQSRSINIAFVRPEWRWRLREGELIEFTPKIYTYLDKEENPDIDDYRGYVDWRVRFDSGGNWIATSVVRIGNAGKGSFLLDVSRRTRDVKFGPVSTYIHVQFFSGYGEDILDYNVRKKSQLRVGFAIVP